MAFMQNSLFNNNLYINVVLYVNNLPMSGDLGTGKYNCFEFGNL
jgi:hypothetical protein